MFNSLKSMIFTEDPNQPPAAKPVARPATTEQVASAGQVFQHQPINDKFVEALRKTVKGRQTAFTSLLDSAETLKAYIPDETTRFRAAFDQIKGQGRTARDIAAAIEVHVQDLAAQQLQFDNALDKERVNTVGSLENELTRLGPANDAAQQQIQSMAQQMAALNETINKNNMRLNELQGLIGAENNRIISSKSQFDVALNVVQTELNGQKSIILSALA